MAPAFKGSVAVRDDRIVGVGKVTGDSAVTLNAGGKVVMLDFWGHW